MNTKVFFLLLYVNVFLLLNNSFAQKTVVIMGSSTAAGFGASSYQLSWAGKLEASFKTNTTDGIDTTFFNIAISGYNSYQEMPTDYTPPAGRPNPDVARNVTKALSYSPNIVIISLPSNDVGAGYSITETMDNLRLMYNSITASRALCYITTTQPRNDYSVSQRKALLDTKDSINIQFGVFAINFWDDLVTSDGLNMLRDDRRYPTSSVHPNDIGHNFLFGRVRDKSIFIPTPALIKITNFCAEAKDNAINIKWHTELQQPNTLFEIQRSSNGINFNNVGSVNIKNATPFADYSVIDKNPLTGKTFYRIKVTDPTHLLYSTIISISNKSGALKITKMYKDNSSGNLIVTINTENEENALITIYNIMGVRLQQKKEHICTPSTSIVLPINNLAAGQYFLKIITNDNNYLIKAFIK